MTADELDEALEGGLMHRILGIDPSRVDYTARLQTVLTQALPELDADERAQLIGVLMETTRKQLGSALPGHTQVWDTERLLRAADGVEPRPEQGYMCWEDGHGCILMWTAEGLLDTDMCRVFQCSFEDWDATRETVFGHGGAIKDGIDITDWSYITPDGREEHTAEGAMLWLLELRWRNPARKLDHMLLDIVGYAGRCGLSRLKRDRIEKLITRRGKPATQLLAKAARALVAAIGETELFAYIDEWKLQTIH